MLLLKDRKVCLGNGRVSFAVAHQRCSFERMFVELCLRRGLASIRCTGLWQSCYDDLEYHQVQVGHLGEISWSGEGQGLLWLWSRVQTRSFCHFNGVA